MKLAVAQFEPKNGDKTYNLSVIRQLSEKAKSGGADLISFHEMSVSAYTFTRNLSHKALSDLAEKIPDGNSTRELIRISRELDLPILAGLVEKEDHKLYNAYICVSKDGLLAKHRKIHPFINKHLSPGNGYCVFELLGWKCGILICYDNNVIENVRATSLLGAEILFAPHVTCCTPSPMPGRGYVEDKYWQNREKDPDALRAEFDGPKGREWLLRWLPARAYDNGIYCAYTNPIGYDGEQIKNGNSMIIDPFGEIIAEIRSFGNDITMAEITKEKLKLSGGWRYKNARKPELYREIIGRSHTSQTRPAWMKGIDRNN